MASEASDLRAQALYDCCHFDALLEYGIRAQYEIFNLDTHLQVLTGRVKTWWLQKQRLVVQIGKFTCLTKWRDISWCPVYLYGIDMFILYSYFMYYV